MSKSLIAIFSVAAGLVLGVTFPAQASLSLTVGGAYYVGSIDPANENPDGEAALINKLIAVAKGASSTEPFSPPPGSTRTFDRTDSTVVGALDAVVYANGFFKNNSIVGGDVDLPDMSSYQYILAKYGNGPSLVWYNADGFSGQVFVPTDNPLATNGGGLSHATAFNPGVIPEPTAALVWATLAGVIAPLARRRK